MWKRLKEGSLAMWRKSMSHIFQEAFVENTPKSADAAGVEICPALGGSRASSMAAANVSWHRLAHCFLMAISFRKCSGNVLACHAHNAQSNEVHVWHD